MSVTLKFTTRAANARGEHTREALEIDVYTGTKRILKRLQCFYLEK